MTESWSDVPGYNGIYKVSNLGNIKSKRRGRYEKKLSPFISTQSRVYEQVKLTDDNGKVKSYYVHRLVYSAFYGEIEKGKEIDHIDTNPHNNRLDNLRQVSRKNNMNNPLTKKHLCEGQRKRYSNSKNNGN